MLTAVGFAVTIAGSNADLNDPIAAAVRHFGYTVADPTLVADTDIDNVTDAQTDEYFDVAEYRMLENIAGNLDDVDIKLGPQAQALGQLATALEKRLARLQTSLERKYGFGLQPLTTGVLQMGFQQEDTTT